VIERRTAFLGGGVAGWTPSGSGDVFLRQLLNDLGGWPPHPQLGVRGGSVCLSPAVPLACHSQKARPVQADTHRQRHSGRKLHRLRLVCS
jgi:hypothetical protein